MAEEGIIIQHMLTLFSQSVEGFTHISYPGNEADTGTGWEGSKIGFFAVDPNKTGRRLLLANSRINTLSSSGEGFSNTSCY